MPGTLARRDLRADRHAFTLVEMMVAIAVLALFILMVTRLVNSARIVTTIGNQHMDADSQARSVLDRMAVDFSQMVKRADVDYLLKQPSNLQTGPNANTGKNDQIAFYSQAEGYYPTSSQSHLSVVAYRLNSDSTVTTASLNKLERLGRGLAWNGDSSGTPILFLPIPLASPFAAPVPSPMPNPSPTPAWPQAGNMSADLGNYEVVGPQVFRFEYYYVLTSGAYSLTPWDTTAGHTAVWNGFQDVSAIGVTIAVIDPQSRVSVSDAQLATLAGQMRDFSLTNLHSGGGATQPGDLDAQWQLAVNASTDPVPRAAASAIRIYSRLFPIAH